MKNPKCVSIRHLFALVFCFFVSVETKAQYTDLTYKNGTYVNDMILSRRNTKRASENRKKDSKVSAKTNSRAKSKNITGIKKSVDDDSNFSPEYNYISIKRDSFQDFHINEGYTVNFTFSSLTTPNKIFSKSFKYDPYNDSADFNGIPQGKYLLKAEAVYAGKKYPVCLSNEIGTPSNPGGGNFTPSLTVEIKFGTNNYGEKVLQTSPESIYVRVTE